MISPSSRPLRLAGLFSATLVITTVLSSGLSPYWVASSSVSGLTSKPRSANDSASPAVGRFEIRPSFSATSSSPSVTSITISLPLRITVTGTVLSTEVSATIRGRSRLLSTFFESNEVMTSPASMPALAAGPSSLTEATSAPATSFSPSESAISSVTS